MDKKYVLTDETITVDDGTVLHRIKAVRSFGLIYAGELGGFVESEDNLSHDGNCWIFGDAMVYGYASVSESAHVYDNATINGHSHIYGNADVMGRALVTKDSSVCGMARVIQDAQISYSWVGGDARVCGNAIVQNCGVDCDAEIDGNSYITKNSDLLVFRGFGRAARTTTICPAINGDINVVCGCFAGNLKEFRSIVRKTHKYNAKLRKEYLKIADLAKLHFTVNSEV